MHEILWKCVGFDNAFAVPPLNSTFGGLEPGGDLSGLVVHRLAAFWYDLRRSKDQALAHHEVILEQEPTDLGALAAVVSNLQHAGRKLDGLETARRALAAEPEHFLALQYAACFAVKLGLYDDAKDYVQRAIEVAADVNRSSFLLKVTDGFTLAVSWFACLLRGSRALASVPEIPSVQVSRNMKEWKQWAHQYLDWHAKTVVGPSTPLRNFRTPSNTR